MIKNGNTLLKWNLFSPFYAVDLHRAGVSICGQLYNLWALPTPAWKQIHYLLLARYSFIAAWYTLAPFFNFAAYVFFFTGSCKILCGYATAFANVFWLAFCALLGFTWLISGYLVITVFFPYCFRTNCFPICPLTFRNNKLLVLCAICSGLSTSKLIFQAGKCKHPSFILRLSFVFTGSNSPVCRQITA